MTPRHRWPVLLGLALWLTCVAGCRDALKLPPALPRVVKIGLVAPFEGRYRASGYDAIYAARLAVRQINAAGKIAVALVAYDDRGDPAMAQIAARNLVADPEVVAVIGHYRQTTTAAAAPIYAAAGVPLITIGAWITATRVWQMAPPPTTAVTLPLDLTDARDGAPGAARFRTPYPLPEDVPDAAAWRAEYQAVGPHTPPPGRYALPTYEAVLALAQALELAPAPPTTSAIISATLPHVQRHGLLGDLAWDAQGFWRAAPLYEYCREPSGVRLCEPD